MSVKLCTIFQENSMYFDETMTLEDAYSKWIQSYLILDESKKNSANYFDWFGLLGFKGHAMAILEKEDYKKSLKDVSMTLQNEKVILLRGRFRGQN